MTLADYLSTALMALSIIFFIAGTVGLFRFPDLYSRLHALTKADNVGLGLMVLALMLQAEHWQTVVKLGLIWVMVSVASANVCILIANESLRRQQKIWTKI
jgi:multicomponent Na+:H+ antiporter subunit G